MSNSIDDFTELADEFGEPHAYDFRGVTGECSGWPARQDETARRAGAARLLAGQRDFIAFAASLPRMPEDGDKITIDGTVYTVRPRDDGECFVPCDRKRVLIRIYLVK